MFKATRSKISMLLKMLSISNAPQYCKKADMNSLITAKVYSKMVQFRQPMTYLCHIQ